MGQQGYLVLQLYSLFLICSTQDKKVSPVNKYTTHKIISVECNQGRRTVRETDVESIDRVKGVEFRSNLCFGPPIIIRYKNVGVAWLGHRFQYKGVCKCDGEQSEEE